MRVLSIVGNRPQFIKSAPLSAALREAGIDEVVLHTGSTTTPSCRRSSSTSSASASRATVSRFATRTPSGCSRASGAAVEQERPDWVLVYGDTNSTLAGAEAAGETPVAHVEAGLRSFDLSMPEERNRIAVDQMAALLLCPDERSAAQLASEGVTGRAEVVGDVMADASRLFTPIARGRSEIFERLGVEPDRFVLVTVHREANVQPQRLARIAAGLDRLDDSLVFPAHPRTRAALDPIPHRFELIDPLGYLDFAALASQARVILTDSGGVQKEAYWYGVPCVTMRPNTEWVDTVETGANVLVDDDPEAIVGAVAAARFPADAPQLYGDGHASERVAAALYASRP